LRVPLPVSKTLQVRRLLEQLLFSQQLSWLEPSLQVLRHRQEQHQLSSQRPF
jgi:hypothetical protein